MSFIRKPKKVLMGLCLITQTLPLWAGNAQDPADLTLTKRLTILEAISNDFEKHYIFYSMKPYLIAREFQTSFDPEAHFRNCIIEEKRYSKPSTKLAFTDRVRKCLAGFHDGHIFLEHFPQTPKITTGLKVQEIENRIIITGKESGTLPEDVDHAISIGSELLAMDGLPVEHVLENLSSYIGQSTKAATRSRSLRNLMARSYQYPNKSSVLLTLNDKGVMNRVRIPWLALQSEANDDLEAWEYLERLGIPKKRIVENSETTWVGFNKVKVPLYHFGSFEQMTSDFVRNTVYQYYPINEMIDPDLSKPLPEPHLQFGIFDSPDEKPYCYFKLDVFPFTEYSFSVPSFQRKKEKDYVMHMESSIYRNILQTCEARGLPLAIDLRDNHGGNPMLVYSLLSGLNAEVELFTYTRLGVEMLSACDRFYAPKYAGNNRWRQVDAYCQKTYSANDQVFTGRLVVLTSENCASGCDIFSHAIKKYNRGKLMGSHPYGLGGDAGISQTYGGFFGISIPTTAWSVNEVSLPRTPTIENFAPGLLKLFSLAQIENLPVLIDEEVPPSFDDCMNWEDDCFSKHLYDRMIRSLFEEHAITD